MHHPPASQPEPVLFSDRGCPFAHRVLSFLRHLGVEHVSREAPVGQRPEGVERWSPSGHLPLLVHGSVTLSESRVMLEHLAEAYAFESAFPRALVARTRDRQAMALMDGFLVPRLAGTITTLDEQRLAECLDALEDVARTPHEPSLLTFHFAPMWLRSQWWHPEGVITRAIRDRTKLVLWLDSAANLPAVVATAPSQAENVSDFHAACLARASRRP